MTQEKQENLYRPSPDFVQLKALEAIERNPRISQRELAGELGIALGFANACVKNMVKRGLVKLGKAKGKKLLYTLTPRGIAEKASLSYRALVDTVSFYSRAKDLLRGGFERMREDGARRIVLYGGDDLLEIVAMTLGEFDFETLGVVRDGDGRAAGPDYGLRRLSLEEAATARPDAIVWASFRNYKECSEEIRGLEKKGLTVRYLFDM